MDQTTKKSKVPKPVATKGSAIESTTKRRKQASKKGKAAKGASSDRGSDYGEAISPPKKKKEPTADVVKAPTVE
jgi:hypothetical protein